MIIVAGIVRSGLTLTMQMLNAGGYPCAGEYPAFEEYDIGDIPWDEMYGKAVKLVDAQLQIPPDAGYRVIRLHRNMIEQARSTNKLNNLMMGLPNISEKKLKKSFIRDYQIIDKWAKRFPLLRLNFEELINNPLGSAQELNLFCGGDLDEKKMAAVVVKRDASCYPGLLELTMV